MSVSGRRILCGLMALVVLVVIAIRYAEPFQDGDLFWHMAYAKQMLARGTLQLDHTTFSWTPTNNHMIYCAWASELLLYEMWQHLGPWSLFALRYFVIIGVAVLLWDFSRQLRLASWPMTYLILLIAVLAENAGTLIKAELFSLLFWNLVVWAFFRAKRDAEQGKSPVRWYYLVPLLVMFWVNFHGAFILVAPFLLATAAGEGLNLLVSFEKARDLRAFRHQLCAWALCGIATMINPYGLRYPSQLFGDYMLGLTPRPDGIWNTAYQSVIVGSMAVHGLTLVHLMAVMVFLLVAVLVFRALFSRGRLRADFTLALANAVYIPLFVTYVRGTSFWIPVFAYTFLFVSGQVREQMERADLLTQLRPVWKFVLTVMAVLTLTILSGVTLYGAWRWPPLRSWVGFGIAYWNPVPEAEFLADSKLEPRLINLFDNGGYLLWRLAPQYLVMTDQRSFPYLSWFDQQYKFTNGKIFNEFLAAHPADTAVIDLSKELVILNFLHAQNWKLVYYGPTAAIFVRTTVPDSNLARNVAPDRFDHLRNAGVAFRVFRFATNVGDFHTAWKIEEQIETTLSFQATDEQKRVARQYREGHDALRFHDYARAKELFNVALKGQNIGDRDMLIQLFLTDIDKLDKAGRPNDTGNFKAALDKLAAQE